MTIQCYGENEKHAQTLNCYQNLYYFLKVKFLVTEFKPVAVRRQLVNRFICVQSVENYTIIMSQLLEDE